MTLLSQPVSWENSVESSKVPLPFIRVPAKSRNALPPSGFCCHQSTFYDAFYFTIDEIVLFNLVQVFLEFLESMHLVSKQVFRITVIFKSRKKIIILIAELTFKWCITYDLSVKILIQSIIFQSWLWIFAPKSNLIVNV